MKLIEQYTSETEAEAAQKKLRKRGIHTYISSVNSYRLSSFLTGAWSVGLWATFNNQYVDACKILAGKQCKVRHPLTEEQMRAIESANKEHAPAMILNFLAWVIGGFAVLGLILYRVYGNA